MLGPKEPIELTGSENPSGPLMDPSMFAGGEASALLAAAAAANNSRDNSIGEGSENENDGSMNAGASLADMDSEDGVKCIKCEKTFHDIFM